MSTSTDPGFILQIRLFETKVGAFGSRDQDSADDEVGCEHSLFELEAVGRDGLDCTFRYDCSDRVQHQVPGDARRKLPAAIHSVE